VPIYFTIMIT